MTNKLSQLSLGHGKAAVVAAFTSVQDDSKGTVSGNKARKLYHVLHALQHGLLPPSIQRLTSYGGAQSNAMLAVAQVAAMAGLQFRYYTRPIPERVLAQPRGCLAEALALGMELVQCDSQPAFARKQSQLQLALDEQAPLHEYWANDAVKQLTMGPASESTPVMPPPHLQSTDVVFGQGGASAGAHAGLACLAMELESQFPTSDGAQQLSIVAPAGTGATAFHLARELAALGSQHAVYAAPVVGPQPEYLLAQFAELAAGCGDGEQPASWWPTILCPRKMQTGEPKYHFARPLPSLWATWEALQQQSGVAFDLLYAPRAWQLIQDNVDRLMECRGADSSQQPALMYLHTGGLQGNATQIERYPDR